MKTLPVILLGGGKGVIVGGIGVGMGVGGSVGTGVGVAFGLHAHSNVDAITNRQRTLNLIFIWASPPNETIG
jgi:hypothetical protein